MCENFRKIKKHTMFIKNFQLAGPHKFFLQNAVFRLDKLHLLMYNNKKYIFYFQR